MIDVVCASGGYFNKPILQDISFQVKKSEFFGIIGPNGSGKTTLLKMVSHILPVRSGDIKLAGKSITSYTTKDFARLMAVLPQHVAQTFSYTVRETVSLGRYAHQLGWLHSFTEDDARIVENVMVQTGIQHYQDVPLDNLSGGERQRVFLAQALAQDPEILLLDEPTNHLDLAYQKELLDVLKSWTSEKGITVVSIFHDLNLAGLYCDRLLLLDKGKMVVCGAPDEVLKQEIIQNVYDTAIEKYPHPKVPKPQMMLVPKQNEMNQQHIHQDLLRVSHDMITLHAPTPLRTMSSGVTGSGVGWYRDFVNRHVGKDYKCDDHKQEMAGYLKRNGFNPHETVGMMTAVNLDDYSSQFLEGLGFSLFVVVTAGAGNAVDASVGEKHGFSPSPGTINIWMFVNAELTEEAFIQCIMTATEVKAKALQVLHVMDEETHTIATGTSTDSMLIAATQNGTLLPFGGTITPLGSLVGKGVFACTKEALQNSFARRFRP